MSASSYYSNRCKCISMVILLLLSSTLVGLGGFVYYKGYLKIIDMRVDGKPYLPEVVVNFDIVQDQLFYSCASSGLILALLLPTLYYRTPCMSLVFILSCVLVACWVMWTAKLFVDFQINIIGKEDICSLKNAMDL